MTGLDPPKNVWSRLPFAALTPALTTLALRRRIARRDPRARPRAGYLARPGVSRSHLGAALTCASGTTVLWLARVADALGVELAELVEAPRGPARQRRR